MQIVHRISINSTPEIRRELAGLGIIVGRGDDTSSNTVTFEISEANETWPAVQAWAQRCGALDFASTTFSTAEVDAAEWLELQSEWYHGYPQPKELDYGYLQATYDLSEYCERCGIGLKQEAPFQMKGEPKWGRKSILQLNWVFDEYFVTPEVWEAVFKPHSIDCRPVLNTKGTELKTVVQLLVRDEVDVVTNGLAVEEAVCLRCSRTKYLPIARGTFPALIDEPFTAMVKTRQFFGSGASAHRGVLIAQRVVRALTTHKVRGVSFRPTAQPHGKH